MINELPITLRIMNTTRFLLALSLLVAPACGQAQTPAAQAVSEANQDSLIFAQTIERAQRERLDTLPVGELIAQVGSWFVGAPYTPHTIEQPGPEQLVINLREFDCVTFVENMLAFARTIRAGNSDFAAFKSEIQRLRYRDGTLDGYPSRLHYFSEWIANNEAKGVVHNETPALGVVDPEPIDFMSTHRESYGQLTNAAFYDQIVAMEKRLTAAPRYMIPQAEIAKLEQHIRNGDVIAATSSVKGLDVAHTGIAVWRNGRLHLMHAPLVGDSVEISAHPLADRILDIPRQDGIMVARPL
jgi:hypothetical protein